MTKLAFSNMVRIRDIMSADVFALDGSETIEVAATELTERHIGGAPVVMGKRVVGVVSKSDLIDHRRVIDRGQTVDAIMTKVLYAVRPTDSVMSAVRLMVRESIHRVVVVAESGRLAGILSAMDVMTALSRGYRIQEPFVDAGGVERHAEPEHALDFVDLRTFTLES